MSINWVMLTDEGFTPLPGEQRLYTSPPRTAFSISSIKGRGKDTYTLQSSTGCVHLTNRRIVYLPLNVTKEFQSFSAPILNLHDTHVAAPFFGPNVWTALLQPVSGGGLPAHQPAFEVKLTFKDGGAFDFHSTFERIKERLQQAVDVARESGHLTGDGSETGGGRGPGALNGVIMDGVHLDELPAYESSGQNPLAPGVDTRQTETHQSTALPTLRQEASHTSESGDFIPPTEPPPGYEEVQRDGVIDEVERRLRRSGS